MLVDRSFRDLLDAFSSTDPTPGGGSASAMASAVGASLLMMVAGMPKTRSGAPEEKDELARAASIVSGLRTRLTAAVDADTAAYDRVVAAYRLPKASADEQAARQQAIQAALRAATDVPLDVVRWSAQALEQAVVVARNGYRAAASDIGVAAALLQAGATGARLNVEINVGSVKDAAYVESVRGELQSLTAGIAASYSACGAES